MVPYRSCSITDIYNVITSSSIPTYWPISTYSLYHLKKRFLIPFTLDTFYTIFYPHFFFIPYPT